MARTGIRAGTGLRQLKKACAPAPFDVELPPRVEAADDELGSKLQVARSCYICKRDFDRVHFHYDALCPDCAALNWERRNQTFDLSGRYSLLTGGRVKIGYQAALKLLRAGADRKSVVWGKSVDLGGRRVIKKKTKTKSKPNKKTVS